MQRFRYLIFSLTVLTLGYMFSGGDCGTDSDEPTPATSVAAPTGVNVSLNQASGWLATVYWNHSADQNRSDFSGYKVVTYEVDTANNPVAVFRTDNVPKTSNSQVLNSIVPLKRYRSYVTARLSNNVVSDSVATKVFAAVYEKEDGAIDEFMQTGTAQSGYGWNVDFGIGTQYPFTQGNTASIDLHVRRESSTSLRFHSPSAYPPGTRMTAFELVGQGQAAFDQTDLNEPTSPSIAVIPDNVYLLKLESGHYVKIWVKEITTPPSANYQRVTFSYKVQPIAGLRVLKR